MILENGSENLQHFERWHRNVSVMQSIALFALWHRDLRSLAFLRWITLLQERGFQGELSRRSPTTVLLSGPLLHIHRPPACQRQPVFRLLWSTFKDLTRIFPYCYWLRWYKLFRETCVGYRLWVQLSLRQRLLVAASGSSRSTGK